MFLNFKIFAYLTRVVKILKLWKMTTITARILLWPPDLFLLN